MTNSILKLDVEKLAFGYIKIHNFASGSPSSQVTKSVIFTSFLYLLFPFVLIDADNKAFGESGLKVYVDLYDHLDEDLKICVYPSDDESSDECQVANMLDYEFEPAMIGPFKFDSDEIEEYDEFTACVTNLNTDETICEEGQNGIEREPEYISFSIEDFSNVEVKDNDNRDSGYFNLEEFCISVANIPFSDLVTGVSKDDCIRMLDGNAIEKDGALFLSCKGGQGIISLLLPELRLFIGPIIGQFCNAI